MATSDLSLEAQIRKLWEIHFFATPHNFANGPHFVALIQVRATKTWSKICCTHCWELVYFWEGIIHSRVSSLSGACAVTYRAPTFHIHFLNPECVRIPWVLAPKNFPVENFRVRSVLQKSSIFHWFLLPPPKKKYRARVPTIMTVSYTHLTLPTT